MCSFPKANLEFLTMASSTKVIPRTVDNRELQYGRLNLEYLFLWNYDRYRRNFKRQLGFSTMASSKKVFPNDCDNDRQSEIAIWPPKPEIPLLQLIDTSSLWVQSVTPQPPCPHSDRDVSSPVHCRSSSKISPEPLPYELARDTPNLLYI